MKPVSNLSAPKKSFLFFFKFLLCRVLIVVTENTANITFSSLDSLLYKIFKPATDTYRHDLLHVVQGRGCHANKGVLVTWYSRWSEKLPVKETKQVTSHLHTCVDAINMDIQCEENTSKNKYKLNTSKEPNKTRYKD